MIALVFTGDKRISNSVRNVVNIIKFFNGRFIMSRLKNIFYRMNNTYIGLMAYMDLKLQKISKKINNKLTDDSGNWLDESFKYILAVVIGLAFLAGLYAITKDTILPTLTNKIREGFNFRG